MTTYTGPIIDAHHHLWRYDADRYSWFEGRDIGQDWTAQDYDQTFAGYDIVGTVWIEALAADPIVELADIEAVRQATNGRIGSALIAHVALDAPDVAARLDRCRAVSPAFRGVRDILTGPHARSHDLLERPEFRSGLMDLAARGLTFDMMLSPSQLYAAADLLAQLPTLKVAVEHVGSPHDRSDAGLRLWRDGLAALARLPNCIVKVSALQCLEPDWTDHSLARIMDPLVQSFGPERMCMGTDWPVHDTVCPGPEAIKALERLTADWSEKDRRLLFYETAAGFYSI